MSNIVHNDNVVCILLFIFHCNDDMSIFDLMPNRFDDIYVTE